MRKGSWVGKQLCDLGRTTHDYYECQPHEREHLDFSKCSLEVLMLYKYFYHKTYVVQNLDGQKDSRGINERFSDHFVLTI